MSKCEYCGSRQFKIHNSVSVCTYCRSEQEVVPVSPSVVSHWAENWSAMYLERLSMYGSSVLRPEKVVRIEVLAL